ncbi:MAG: hypothetical protein LLG04_13620 [Parachlamydia sp.]|nr:hypothetical protein [Parachlamydia sp.]
MSSIKNIFTPPVNLFQQPAFYAKSKFIQDQRIIGVALIAIGILASLFSPLTMGSTAAIAAPCIALGGFLIGASLIQQVVGNSYGCSEGRIKRVAAGICIMMGGPIGWAIGGLLWHFSNRDNNR